jgi:hypothetical protein
LGFLGTYKDRLEGELQFLSRSVPPAPSLSSPESWLARHGCLRLCSAPPASYLEFGRPTTRRKSGSGAGREEEEEEVPVPSRGHAPSTPHATAPDRHEKGSDRHRHRTPRSHDKRAPAIPLDQGDSTPVPSIPSSRDRSGASRPRSSKSKHGSGAESSAEVPASASQRQNHSSLISLREDSDSLPLTREVQDLMARQKVRRAVPFA